MGKTMSNLKQVLPGSFIYMESEALSPRICADLIEVFESHPDKQYPGVVASGQVNRDLKRSTDFNISVYDEFKSLDKVLEQSTGEILNDYPHKEWMHGDLSDSGYQIKRTQKGEFYGPHYDTDGAGSVALRQLVILWYLNDVERGGHTKFHNQKIKIKPQTGTAIVFPPFWTHMHEGMPVLEGTKYITTTWITFQRDQS